LAPVNLMATSLVVRVQNPAWIRGALGLRVQSRLEWLLHRRVRVERLPIGFSVCATGQLPNLRDRLIEAVRQLEVDMQRIEPVNYSLLGPVTQGTVDCITPLGVTRAWDAAASPEPASAHG
jgi:hypothetical protein